jgi:hypothetical protein
MPTGQVYISFPLSEEITGLRSLRGNLIKHFAELVGVKILSEIPVVKVIPHKSFEGWSTYIIEFDEVDRKVMAGVCKGVAFVNDNINVLFAKEEL